MKTQLNIRLLLIPALIAAFLVSTLKCTHEDAVLDDIDDSIYEYGEDIVSADDGFTFDKSHSSVLWETEYQGVSALLTGRFNSFTMAIEFDEDNPENIELSGSVVLSSVNTGEPGRDQGCLLGTFGTTAGGTEEATFVSTSVELDGVGGYIVTGTFDFNGATDEIVGKLTYSGTTFVDRGDADPLNDYNLAGFIMEFDILAKSVHGIVSGNIADRVHIKCSGQFKDFTL